MSKLRLLFYNFRRYKFVILGCTVGAGLTGFKSWSNRTVDIVSNSSNANFWKQESDKIIPIENIPNRSQQIQDLQKHNKPSSSYDIIVIGGGATGSGIALDAATRGLTVALIDCCDFSSGTSSRSTKLIHGGVRYLEDAIMKLDIDSWNLVSEAILERRHLINLTPHLSYPLPIILPVYDENIIRGTFLLMKHYIGLKIYEAIAGKDGLLCPTYYLSSPHTKTIAPHLKQQNMIGSIVYYDGIHNDSRMNLLIALTASHYGASIANYVSAVDFIRDSSSDSIIGVRMRDSLTGCEWNTFGSVVINATGFGVDKLRKKDDVSLSSADNLIVPSRGTHLIFPSTFSSPDYGVLIPKTADGRVAFLLPFEGVTIAGTTDVALNHNDIPNKKTSDIQLISPTQIEANTIVDEINNYLDFPVSVSDVDAVWSGIRPLAVTPNGYTQKIINGTVNIIQKDIDYDNKSDSDETMKTANISRHHLIEISSSGLITICGGKWTTYRQMAQDTLDLICSIKPSIGHRATECVSKMVKLIGSASWTQCVPAILERHEIPADIAQHLSRSYGDKSFIVGNIYLSSYCKLLACGYPYTEAEVIYCTKYEMSQTPIDILSRRTRLAQLSRSAAEYALPKVINLMGDILNWNIRHRVQHFHDSMEFLRTMHVEDRHKWGRSRHTLDYARRVVETVLNGPSMTDEAIQFVIDSFWDLHEENIGIYHDDDDDDDDNDHELTKQIKKHKQSRQLFEGCISRAQCKQLAKQFSTIFGDDRVIDALMFTQQQQFGLYEILVSCAACASHRELFHANYYYE